MRTNIDINEDLMLKAQKLSKLKTKKAVIQKALELFVVMENQNKLSELRGKIQMDDEAYL